MRIVRFLCVVGGLACWAAQSGYAHDIPSSATVLMYVKPEGDRLTVLLRLPMETLSEIQFPVRGPGYLDLDNVHEALEDAVQVYLSSGLELFVEGESLGAPALERARVTLPSNVAFTDYERALAHLSSASLTNEIDLFWNQAMLDVALEYTVPPGLAVQEDIADGISFRTAFNRLAEETLTVLRFLPAEGVERSYTFTGDPGIVDLDPGWWSAVSRFVVLGFFHILEGADHLLFLLALMIPMRSIGALVLVVTSFTVAHTITRVSAALGLMPTTLWFPALIETLIAFSVFYMACENLFGPRQDTRWMIAFGFGLVHGFGFSFILADRLQFAGSHLIGSLLAFNIGVELGQLLVVVITVPALWLVFRWFLKGAAKERIGIILLSALVGHSAWHWLVERGGQLLQYSWSAPALDAAFFAAATRWAMLAVGSALVLFAMNEIVNRLRRVGGPRGSAPGNASTADP